MCQIGHKFWTNIQNNSFDDNLSLNSENYHSNSSSRTWKFSRTKMTGSSVKSTFTQILQILLQRRMCASYSPSFKPITQVWSSKSFAWSSNSKMTFGAQSREWLYLASKTLLHKFTWYFYRGGCVLVTHRVSSRPLKSRVPSRSLEIRTSGKFRHF